MDGSEDYPDEPQPESTYPDLDDDALYPWRSTQLPAGLPASSQEGQIIYEQLRHAGGPSSRLEKRKFDAYTEADESDEEYQYSGENSTEGDDDSDLDDEEDLGLGRRGRKPYFFGRPYSHGARGGKGIKRGPRKPLEPSPEFKLLHSDATSAFIDGDYPRAAELVQRAILINPEIFAAHALLSEILLSQGHKEKAVAALFSGAHTRPRDPSVWAKVAKLLLELAGDDRASALKDVVYCYSRVVEIDQKNYSARFQRAAIYREMGHNGKAAGEYERLLKDLPHNMRALRSLTEVYIDLNEIQKAKERYEDSIAYYQNLPLEEVVDFSWSDVNIYTELFSYLGQYREGLFMLKSLSRWLLGRQDDVGWDEWDEDDREWDENDMPRRIKAAGFIPGMYPLESYGLGLPLELRVKLGIYRLKADVEQSHEAMFHFDWLGPDNTAPGAKLYDYGDLFREAADALKDAGLYDLALRFYMPLQETHEYADTSFFMAMGQCFLAVGNEEEAESCLLTVVEHDHKNVEARVQLARFYERMGFQEQAFKYVNEAVLLGRQETTTRHRRRRVDARVESLANEFRAAQGGTVTAVGHALAVAGTAEGSGDGDYDIGDNIRFLYSKLMELQPVMRNGDQMATDDWLDIADALLRDFRSNRVFFPLQRSMVFLGYSREAKKKAGKLKNTMMDEMQEMAGRLQASLGTAAEDDQPIPTDYHGIRFDAWLDIFLEYALVLSGQDEPEEAYDALGAAADASIWYHSKRSMRLIHVCWFTCALRMKDEETLCNIARWFMKEYQFVTDTYRLFTTLSRVCASDPRRSFFSSSPSMKFMLRQIKAMDYTLPPDPARRPNPAHRTRASIYQERASLSTKDEHGDPIPAEEMDVALLTLYGHILYAGTSFTNALNYLFRAYALDDENPAVLLSIGLCYIHHALKRQSDNRHYLIMEGIAFMQQYRRVREKSPILQERQEMEFNFARVWHMLGLAHLAIPGYEACLRLSEEIQMQARGKGRFAKGKGAERERGAWARDSRGGDLFVEDFGREAAMALQILYAVSGEVALAKRITEKWLVI